MLVGQDQLGKNSPSFMEKQMQTLSIQEGVHSHSFMGKKCKIWLHSFNTGRISHLL